MILRDVQQRALDAAAKAGCLYGAIGVGHGKTLIAAMLPDAIPSERPLLIVPGSTMKGCLRLRASYGALPPCEVWSYEKLSHPKHRGDLEAYKPDLIILDEAHMACGDSTRARRLQAYIREHAPKVCALSGTLLSPKIDRTARLADWVFGQRSPFPARPSYRASLARAVGGEATLADKVKWVAYYKARRNSPDGLLEAIREAVLRTPGAVVEAGVSTDCSLRVEVLEHPLSVVLEDALGRLEKTWELDGLLHCDAMALAETRRQLTTGFYYRWKFAPHPLWLDARREWASAVREYLGRPRKHDSEALIRHALAAGERLGPRLEEAWKLWRLLRTIEAPPTEPVWLDRSVVHLGAAIAKEHGCLLWCDYQAQAQASGLPVCPPEQDPKEGAVCVSTHAHGVGRNLQHYHRSVMLSPLRSSVRWEQLLGRTHRSGQTEDEVVCLVIISGPGQDDFDLAVADARRDRLMTSGEQRLLLGLGVP